MEIFSCKTNEKILERSCQNQWGGGNCEDVFNEGKKGGILWAEPIFFLIYD